MYEGKRRFSLMLSRCEGRRIRKISTIMTRSPNHTLSTIFFIFCVVLCRPIFCAARDSITTGNPVSDINYETLISADKKFQLGFFALYGDSGYSRYIGIWYYMSNPQTIVWVANRDRPLHSPTGVLLIADDGNLEVKDGNGNSSYFSTYLEGSPSSKRTVRLFDSGNLIFSDDPSGKILWQSFDSPTDTFLPGMKMDENLKLTSWKKLNDPGTGNFTFQKEQDGGHYIILKRTINYWISGESGSFDSSDEMPDSIAYLLSNYGTFNTKKGPPHLENNNTRLVMSFSGELQYFNWDNGRWILIWSQRRDRCSVYNACGKFGSCNNENRLVCKCLPGYKPVIPLDWKAGDFSSGCEKKTTTCFKDKEDNIFLNFRVMKVKKPESQFFFAESEEGCKKECLGNCLCRAYSYSAAAKERRRTNILSGCWFWNSDIENLQEHMEGAHNLSVRVARADIESTRRTCKTCGANIIPYPLSTGPNCGDPMYYNFSCNSSTGQVYFFQEPSRIYRVESINPDNRSFIVQLTGKIADISRAGQSTAEVLRTTRSFPYNVPFTGTSNIEISWSIPPEPTCNSLKDCKDWPNSSCNTTSDGKRRCLCNANYHWDGGQLNCTGLEGININVTQIERSREKKKLFSLLAVIISTVVTILVVLLCVSGYIWYRRRKPEQRQERRENIQGNQAPRLFDTERRIKNLIDSGSFKDDDKRGIDVPLFDLESILAATNYFSDENKLGQGGFGPVYKGMFPGGQEIAVKRLSSHSGQGSQEFKNEIVLIAKLQHRNLVRLLGYCINGDEKILLYEYMPNKSLDSFIFDRTRCMSLDWEKRFNIILGVARGLLYLHQDSRLRIIHRDLKTSNILLDGEMNPKISDFGLARIVGGKETEANTNKVVGTYGYMSPEYALDGLFSIKSDVFSFGVIVLEIVSGKRNTGFYKSQVASNLLGHAWRLWNEEKALDLMDEALLESCNTGEIMKCIIVGLLCVQEEPSDRPTMPNVVFMLGSETATLPKPKQPAFIGKKWLSDTLASSSSKQETLSNIELTISAEDGR